MENLKEMPIRELISKYKRQVRNAPFVLSATDEEMDQYYDTCIAYEEEIIRRVEEAAEKNHAPAEEDTRKKEDEKRRKRFWGL